MSPNRRNFVGLLALGAACGLAHAAPGQPPLRIDATRDCKVRIRGRSSIGGLLLAGAVVAGVFCYGWYKRNSR
jgi:hypothetical protein